MEPTTRLALTEASASQASTLLLDGATTTIMAGGTRMVAQFALGTGELLAFVTDDDVYDSALSILLISKDGQCLDRVVNGGLAADALIQNEAELTIDAVEADAIRFRFYRNDRRYRLTVAPNPRWLSPRALPAGFAHQAALSRHRLLLSEDRP